MRKRTLVLIVAMMALFFANPHFVQSNSADGPVAGMYRESARTRAPIPVALQVFTGRVVSMDQDAKTLTVKKTGWLRAQEVMFTVDDQAVIHLADLKQDDWVDITYAEEDGKLIAKTIVKRIGQGDS